MCNRLKFCTGFIFCIFPAKLYMRQQIRTITCNLSIYFCLFRCFTSQPTIFSHVYQFSCLPRLNQYCTVLSIGYLAQEHNTVPPVSLEQLYHRVTILYLKILSSHEYDVLKVSYWDQSMSVVVVVVVVVNIFL